MKKWIGLVLCILTVFSLCFVFSNSMKKDTQVEATKSKVVETVEKVIETIVNKDVSLKKLGKRFIAKVGHVLEYFVFSALLTFTYFYLQGSLPSEAFYRLAFVFSFCALADEHLQSIGEGRSSRVSDVLIDLSACFVGYAVSRGVFVLMERRKKK